MNNVEETGSRGSRSERPVRRPVSPTEVLGHAIRFLRSRRRPPTVFTGEGGRHATWLELFFDLVYVVAVAELGLLLHEDLTITGFLGFTGLFLVVWWTWIGFTLYADQFDTDDIVHRLGMVVVMFGVIALTGTIHDALHGGSATFAVAYLLLRLLYVGMYVRAWLNVRELRPFLGYVVVASSLSATVWAASLLVPEPGRFVVWALSFLVSIVVSVVGYVGFEDIPKPTSHLPERLGLFTILVLGETVLAVAVGTSGTDWRIGSALTALTGFLVAVSVWWTYFGNVDEWLLDRVFDTDEGAWSQVRESSFAHVLGHFVVFVGIVTTGVGISVAIEAAAESHALSPTGAGAVAGGLAIFLLGAAFVHRTTFEPLKDTVFLARLAGAALLAAVALALPTVAPSVFVGLVATLIVGLNVFEDVSAYVDSIAAPDDR